MAKKGCNMYEVYHVCVLLYLTIVQLLQYIWWLAPPYINGCEKWCLTMREEHNDVYRKRMLRIFGPKERRSQEGALNCIIRSFLSCTLHHIQ